jgi:hypothetical protein
MLQLHINLLSDEWSPLKNCSNISNVTQENSICCRLLTATKWKLFYYGIMYFTFKQFVVC